jgi:hypothetical protein
MSIQLLDDGFPGSRLGCCRTDSRAPEQVSKLRNENLEEAQKNYPILSTDGTSDTSRAVAASMSKRTAG